MEQDTEYGYRGLFHSGLLGLSLLRFSCFANLTGASGWLPNTSLLAVIPLPVREIELLVYYLKSSEGLVVPLQHLTSHKPREAE